MPLLLGCIADDLTGATDLANELARSGLRTVLHVGTDQRPAPDNAQAMVIALKTRSIAPDQAVDLSLQALARLTERGAAHIYFKYCSTFDSTPQGNIGPVLDALMAALDTDLTLACPAFPANRRTVYQGHLFVGDRLLEHSGMEKHPLNPMTRSDLVLLLQEQMACKVGLLPHAQVNAAALPYAVEQLRGAGVGAAIADAVDDAQLDALGAQCATMRLSSGGSGLGAGLARHLSRGARAVALPMPPMRGRRVILSGSCSAMTMQQIEAARPTMPSLPLSGLLSMDDGAIINGVQDWIAAQQEDSPVLVYASSASPEVEILRQQHGPDVGERVERLFGAIAAATVDAGCDRLIVAGGETSGAAVAGLGIVELAIGPEIAPGVPWTLATRAGGGQLSLALKSGNFGRPDFFLNAWELLPCLQTN